MAVGLLTCCVVTGLFGQKLPKFMQLNAQQHILYTGKNASAGLYDESGIGIFELWFSQPDYWTQLKNNYATHTDLPATLIVDGDTLYNVATPLS